MWLTLGGCWVQIWAGRHRTCLPWAKAWVWKGAVLGLVSHTCLPEIARLHTSRCTHCASSTVLTTTVSTGNSFSFTGFHVRSPGSPGFYPSLLGCSFSVSLEGSSSAGCCLDVGKCQGSDLALSSRYYSLWVFLTPVPSFVISADISQISTSALLIS